MIKYLIKKMRNKKNQEVFDYKTTWMRFVQVSENEVALAFCTKEGEFTEDTVWLRLKEDGILHLYETVETDAIKGRFTGEHLEV